MTDAEIEKKYKSVAISGQDEGLLANNVYFCNVL